MKYQFKLSNDSQKQHRTAKTSIPPNCLITCLEVETIKKEKRFNATDINPSVEQICTKDSTLDKQPNFRLQVFFVLCLITNVINLIM